MLTATINRKRGGVECCACTNSRRAYFDATIDTIIDYGYAEQRWVIAEAAGIGGGDTASPRFTNKRNTPARSDEVRGTTQEGVKRHRPSGRPTSSVSSAATNRLLKTGRSSCDAQLPRRPEPRGGGRDDDGRCGRSDCHRRALSEGEGA